MDVLRVPVTELDDNLEGVWLGIQNQCRLRGESVGEGRWVQAGALVAGDIVFNVQRPPLSPPVNGGREEVPALVQIEGVTIRSVASEWSEETVYDLEVDGAHSFVTETCAVHNCGGRR